MTTPFAERFERDILSAFILLEGEIHFSNTNSSFLNLITEISLFGYDGPIFQKRLSTAIAEKGTVIGVISRKDFLELIHPFSQFATYLSRNIIYKDKVIDDLPLDPTQVLSQEGSNVSWDEGVCSMNAIQRHILYQMMQ